MKIYYSFFIIKAKNYDLDMLDEALITGIYLMFLSLYFTEYFYEI